MGQQRGCTLLRQSGRDWFCSGLPLEIYSATRTGQGSQRAYFGKSLGKSCPQISISDSGGGGGGASHKSHQGLRTVDAHDAHVLAALAIDKGQNGVAAIRG